MTSLPPQKIDCYLNWISRLTGRQYRLPTEAEWQAVAEIAASQTSQEFQREREVGASQDPRLTVQRRVIRRVGRDYHPAVGLYDLFGNASEVVSREHLDGDWVVVRGGNDFVDQDFDHVVGWHLVPAKSSSATVGFRLVRVGKIHER